MYLIRRIYKTRPGQARKVAIGEDLPRGRSPRRVIPQEAREAGGQVRELIKSQRIEFAELLTPDKY